MTVIHGLYEDQIQFEYVQPVQHRLCQRTTICRILRREALERLDPDVAQKDAKKPRQEGAVIAEGRAACSHLDNFSKEAGRKLALTRALENAGWDKATRAQFWLAYLNRASIVVESAAFPS